MKQLIWLTLSHVLALHTKQIQEHGGSQGIRDQGLLESALAKPQQPFNYAEPTIFELAAAYAYGIAKNHPFVDGNKRTAIVSAGVFLAINGYFLEAPEPEVVQVVLGLADSSLGQQEFGVWLKQNCEVISNKKAPK